ncbi:hypothetical protein HHE06_13550 [Helicobacter heilmannii]|uniref:Uncharacterized protein n=1 Tax=Helicobacter heilmannii TaxID=35817 RepID=A0A0K2XKS4_HELHE|nr:hypothetical protein BN341_7290 [Helicobacter heilmannii ASB1.4]CRF46199.1 hypothetical protein HHE014_11930 [Helicobacter heilmannii]CRF49815.1 hypothetical protein HHE03_14870 [Helicobacter heilmannii]CRF51475.1 hypothetical protein HHE06_13550 [Helicobacter heilmannii]CRI34433.1 hypothetical protein HHE01_12790 [Helicobacter heilmannii]
MQITRITPLLLMTLHLSHIFFTEGLTFIEISLSKTSILTIFG